MSPGGFFTFDGDGALLVLRVTPNARTDTVEGAETRADGTTALKIRVCATPDKGAANAAIVALLAKTLSLPKSAFSLVRGHTARTKLMRVTAPRGDLARKLERLL